MPPHESGPYQPCTVEKKSWAAVHGRKARAEPACCVCVGVALSREACTMANSAHVSRVRSLYKRILLLHRFLPVELRALGDQYVKDEFRRHRAAASDEAHRFTSEWENYKDTLQVQVLESAGKGRNSGNFGADLSEEKLTQFQDEQIGQLYELMLESTKPSQQFRIQEDNLQK
ncbi:succinate dehydrogenase assembly factor 3, mitochondrial [Arapaima gigas]